MMMTMMMIPPAAELADERASRGHAVRATVAGVQRSFSQHRCIALPRTSQTMTFWRQMVETRLRPVSAQSVKAKKGLIVTAALFRLLNYRPY